MKLIHAILKEDPLQKQLRLCHLTTDSLKHEVIASCLQLFRKYIDKEQQLFIKTIAKHLEEKGTAAKKIKIMMAIVEIAKTSNLDVTEMLLAKKIKLFIKPRKFSHGEIEPTPDRLEQFIVQELLIPLYNYQMKLWSNEQLYLNCRSGEIPHNVVYRRGSKIRFIWIFKLYNIINSLLPIVQSIVKLQNMNPDLAFFHECGAILFNDLSTMNNFAIKALEEASEDNFILMPYLDMLQFHQSLKQQLRMGSHVIKAYEGILNFSHGLILPMQLAIPKEELHQIQIQALRVKLISNALKNPKKDHTVLQTQYNQKRALKGSFSMKSMPTVVTQTDLDFKQKWRRLD